MTYSKRPHLGLALALVAALLAVFAPAAFAGSPEEKAEKVAAKESEKAAKESEKAAKEAEKAEGAEKAEKPEKVEKTEKTDKVEAPEKAADQPAAAGEPCGDRVFAPVFKPFNDRRLYTLAPGGDFETLAEGWTLENAVLAADSSPFVLGAALGASSLELPAGATALSPPICVRRGMPSFRFLAKSVSAEQATLKVEILYASGRVKGRGRLLPAAEWAPTKKLSLSQGQFRVKRRGSTQIRLRFAVTAGTARIDDVYIDPRMWR
jgi:hypothetical protein